MARAGVRLAGTDDAGEIARIQRDTWHAVYAEVLGPDALAAIDSPEVDEQWREAIDHRDTDVFVASEGAAIVGFAVSGPAPREDITDAAGALPADSEHIGLLANVLVEPRWQRRGHGGRLLAAAAEALRARGAHRGMSWLAESDSASLQFFRGAGWAPDGTVRTLDTGEQTLREMRLAGSLELHASE